MRKRACKDPCTLYSMYSVGVCQTCIRARDTIPGLISKLLSAMFRGGRKL